MNIEQNFLQKAIKDRNFINSSSENKSYKKAKPFKIVDDVINCDIGSFKINYFAIDFPTK